MTMIRSRDEVPEEGHDNSLCLRYTDIPSGERGNKCFDKADGVLSHLHNALKPPKVKRTLTSAGAPRDFTCGGL